MANTKDRIEVNRSKSSNKALVISLIVLAFLAVSSLFVGAYDILGQEDGWNMFFITRVPRTLSLMLTGSAMALSGLVMQLISQNKFVEPTTTGTIEWAGLGLILVYVLIPNPSLIIRMLGAIVFSFIGTMVFFSFIRRVRLKSSAIVPIIGIMLGSVVSALSTFVALVFDMTQSLEVWFAGSFASVERGRYEFLWIIIVVTFIIYKYADMLTLAGLGEDISTNLGLDYNKIVLMGTGLVALTVGVVAAVIGNIPFLGLIVPNVVSLFRGDDLRSNLVWVGLVGSGILLLCDIIARTIIAPFEVPVSLILTTLGAGVFIVLILQSRRGSR